MMENNFFNFFDESLKIISMCPSCNTRYNPLEARVLGERGDAHVVHITCRHCRAALLAVVMTNQSGLSSVGMLTDLTTDDVQRFKGGSPIKTDDVIMAHHVLTNEAVSLEQLS